VGRAQSTAGGRAMNPTLLIVAGIAVAVFAIIVLAKLNGAS
jgi:preprotein translocase subunit Sec61beta